MGTGGFGFQEPSHYGLLLSTSNNIPLIIAVPLSLATCAIGTREKCDIAVNYKLFKADEVEYEGPFRDAGET
ncbi:hypothetical protein PRIPAC_73865 [Pristionchus pacificus]|uniref:Uncharacterized protein n=1 Tax=Pristionchus pacificus TaxID=54126 RepID=A0A2A6C9H4_PRIPA|nr:hypothetical protein PRIPAC_73865 [Pristionchus pacificus]|eukprot:PDM74671.1 hypothetical protein PRIPAC_42027 [Pristionchus pacificus]